MRSQSGGRGQSAGPARASSPPPNTGATTPRQRWAQLRQSLWQPPRPHGEEPHERVVGPLELLYDLAGVVLVAQEAHHLAGELAGGGLGEFAVVFTVVWIAWANGSLHHELHGHDDARGRSTFLLQILVLAAMGAFIPGAGGARGAAFAVATAVLFAVLALLWVLAARGDRLEYRRSSRLFVTGTAACAVALAGTAFLPASARIPAWGLLDAAYLACFAAVILTATPAQAAAIAGMGPPVATFVAPDSEPPPPPARGWVLCAAAAVVLCATMLVSASLQAWHRDRGLYRPLARTCAAVAVACLGVGAARPAPVILGLALVLLLGIPWALAVAHRLANAADSPSE